jgi:hypothetical protein
VAGEPAAPGWSPERSKKAEVVKGFWIVANGQPVAPGQLQRSVLIWMRLSQRLTDRCQSVEGERQDRDDGQVFDEDQGVPVDLRNLVDDVLIDPPIGRIGQVAHLDLRSIGKAGVIPGLDSARGERRAREGGDQLLAQLGKRIPI